MRHALTAVLILLVGLIVGALADRVWTLRVRQGEALVEEQRRQSEPLLRFGSSLTEMPPHADRPQRISVYVPAYSSIRVANGRSLVQLATTLSIHNTSRDQPLILERIDYHNTQGDLIQAHLDRPVALKPFGVLEVFVPADDARGGAGANFLVEWGTDGTVPEPVIEAVMLGNLGSTSYTFVSQGRTLKATPPPLRP